jgi:hypothetical protein
MFIIYSDKISEAAEFCAGVVYIHLLSPTQCQVLFQCWDRAENKKDQVPLSQMSSKSTGNIYLESIVF